MPDKVVLAQNAARAQGKPVEPHRCPPGEQLPCFLQQLDYYVPRQDNSKMACKWVLAYESMPGGRADGRPAGAWWVQPERSPAALTELTAPTLLAFTQGHPAARPRRHPRALRADHAPR